MGQSFWSDNNIQNYMDLNCYGFSGGFKTAEQYNDKKPTFCIVLTVLKGGILTLLVWFVVGCWLILDRLHLAKHAVDDSQESPIFK